MREIDVNNLEDAKKYIQFKISQFERENGVKTQETTLSCVYTEAVIGWSKELISLRKKPNPTGYDVNYMIALTFLIEQAKIMDKEIQKQISLLIKKDYDVWCNKDLKLKHFCKDLNTVLISEIGEDKLK